MIDVSCPALPPITPNVILTEVMYKPVLEVIEFCDADICVMCVEYDILVGRNR